MSSYSASGLIVAGGRPTLAVAQGPGADLHGAEGAERAPRLPGSAGTVLVHADLHNHTLLSDGAGSPEDAFAAMRAAGLDVAALTDHASVAPGFDIPERTRDNAEAVARWTMAPRSIDAAGWARTGRLADEQDSPGEFTAVRGFEWTEPWLGHVNVWFSEDWTDVQELGGTRHLFDWLAERSAPGPAGTPALAGLNHPGREPGRFDGFRYDARLADRVVSMEMFNRGDDYLFEGWAEGRPSPLLAALDAGWRPGLLGVTDEHGRTWGSAEGRGRGGLWVHEHSRAGVAEALRARRFFATRLSGLRLDAALDGVRIGSELPSPPRAARLELDVDRGPAWAGRELVAQLLRPGADDDVPRVAAEVAVRCGEPVDCEAELGDPPPAGRPDWVVLRLADPDAANRTPGPRGHAANALAVAYASPWWAGRA
ncbi:hypothetical protein CLV35_1266 [Motilibacter peucedani]|uniref:Polymerase/histidinol phosphatase N-terminal domain-containing protein n=1 Tax=Motilibacter peucedani TaxID=598650 RepID=A0A420XRQ0_9ACTN|nr:CehA/McbA family metallohydrolase [Motilibacter peucedani]RKS77573.1 hypothetical protein CLV35_1266 [Motilibacter peucedani]